MACVVSVDVRKCCFRLFGLIWVLIGGEISSLISRLVDIVVVNFGELLLRKGSVVDVVWILTTSGSNVVLGSANKKSISVVLFESVLASDSLLSVNFGSLSGTFPSVNPLIARSSAVCKNDGSESCKTLTSP